MLSMFRAITMSVAVWCAVSSTYAFDTPLARAVAWTTAGEAALERELNAQAARGLRVAAVSDGLPCTVTAMQTPDPAGPPAAYRVVADRDLLERLPQLGEDGFVPRLAHRRTGGRAHVIFERLGTDRATLAWRAIEFPDLDALQPALVAAAADGFRARLLVRYPLKSWPGLSERGLILAAKAAAGRSREALAVIGQSRNLETTAGAIADATSKGFAFDAFFTGSRDGSPQTRRERVVVLMSRESGATPPAAGITLERTTSFGTFGNGAPLGAAPFWDDSYVHASSPAARRQTWASPIRLSMDEASCVGLPLKLRVDAPSDLAWTIVGLAARKLPTNAWELVYITDQRIGG
jgi:hypothetical protein